MNEDEEYEAELEEAKLDGELGELKESLLDDTIRILDPDEPLCVSETVSVEEAVATMMAMRRAAVLVVDREGRLSGIFTERDVLTRVVARKLDPAAALVESVMT